MICTGCTVRTAGCYKKESNDLRKSVSKRCDVKSHGALMQTYQKKYVKSVSVLRLCVYTCTQTHMYMHTYVLTSKDLF